MTGHWLPDVAAARARLEELKEPKGGQPVTSGIAVAYQLLSKVDQETEAPEPLPKLVVVFTDRTAASWDAGRVEDLKKLRDTVPAPKPVHVVLDFGVDSPSNVGILSADMKPQVIAASQAASITVSVGASGGDGTTVNATVVAKPLWTAKPEDFTASRDVAIPAGQSRTAMFEFRDLKPGLHQVEFSLKTPDKLDFDNKRFITFKVGETRRILTITDDIPASAFWLASHAARANPEFACLAVTPEQVQLGDGGTTVVKFAEDKPAEDIRSFEVVCLLNVVNPQQTRLNDGTLWDRLRPYLQTGGKLIIMPGPDTSTSVEGYDVANDLMPGKLKKPILSTRDMNPPPPQQSATGWPAPRDGKNGVTWCSTRTPSSTRCSRSSTNGGSRRQTSTSSPTRGRRGSTGTWNRTRPRRWWSTTSTRPARRPAPGGAGAAGPRPEGRQQAERESTAAHHANGRDAAGRRVERLLGAGGFDVVRDVPVHAGALPRGRHGRRELQLQYRRDRRRAAPARQDRPREQGDLQRPRDQRERSPHHADGKADRDSRRPAEDEPRGQFRAVRGATGPHAALEDGFSVNAPAEESNLEKVPVEAIEDLAGKDRVFSVDRNSTLHEWLTVAMDQPIDLFPWLLIAVLLLFVAEGLTANRFYRRPKA